MKTIWSTLCLALVIFSAISTQNIENTFVNQEEPNSNAVSRVYLSINSTYYHLQNINIKIAESDSIYNMPTDWKFCDPQEIITHTTYYKLLIFDVETDNMIWRDGEWIAVSEAYRIINLTANEFINDYNTRLNIETSSNDTLLEYQSGNYMDWSDTSGIIDNLDEFEDWNSVSKMNGGSTAFREFTEDYLTMNFWVRFENDHGMGEFFYIDIVDEATDVIVFRIEWRSGKTMSYWDGGGTHGVEHNYDWFQEGSWYHLSLYVDFIQETVSFLQDNEIIVENNPFATIPSTDSTPYSSSTDFYIVFDTITVVDEVYFTNDPFLEQNLTIDAYDSQAAYFYPNQYTEVNYSVFCEDINYDNAIIEDEEIYLSNPYCQYSLTLIDQSENHNYLNFEDFRIYKNGTHITEYNFKDVKAQFINFSIHQLDGTYIQDEIFYLDEDSESFYATINVLNIQNNANEPINVSLVENGHYQSSVDLSWGLETPHTHPSNLQYSDDSLMYLENEYQAHNKVMSSEGLNTTTYNYKTQFNEPKEGVQQWNSSTYDYKKDPYLPYTNIAGVEQWGSEGNDDFSDWTIDTDTTMIVNGNIDGHKDVNEFSSNGVDINYIQVSEMESGVFEGYIKRDSMYPMILLGSIASGWMVHLRYQSDTSFIIYYGNGIGGTNNTVISVESNSWVHVSVEFDTFTDTFDCSVNGILEISGKNFYSDATSSTGLNKIGLYSPIANSKGWYDSFGWGVNYIPNSNRNFWGFTDLSVDETDISIIEEYDSKKDVINITSKSPTGNFKLERNGLEETTNGTYEITVQNSAASGQFYIILGDEDQYNSITLLMWSSGNILVYDGSYTIIKSGMLANQWYDVRIDYNLDADTPYFDIWVNSEYIGYYENIRGNPTAFDYMMYQGQTIAYDNHYYISEISYGNNYISELSQIPDAGFGKIFDETYYQGSFEWWQNNAINSSKFFLGNTSISWSETNLSIWNSTDYDIIETENQLTNTWNHYQLIFNNSGVNLYRNSILLYSDSFQITVSQFQFMSVWNAKFKIDAIEYNFSNPLYVENQNLQLNTSSDLWCWEAFPSWNETYGLSELSEGWIDQSTSPNSIRINQQIGNHYNVMEMSDIDINSRALARHLIDNAEMVEFSFRYDKEIEVFAYIYNEIGQLSDAIYINNVIGQIHMYNGIHGGRVVSTGLNVDNWYHVKFTISENYLNVYFNGILVQENLEQPTDSDFAAINFYTSITGSDYSFYVSNLDYNTAEGYFLNRSLLENTTASPLSMNYNFTSLVNPYSNLQAKYEPSNYLVNIADLYGNNLETQALSNSSDSNSITFTPPNMQPVFISLADQQNTYLNWENYRLYQNTTQIYENLFYGEIGTTWNISVYDRFDEFLTSTSYSVLRENNYCPITLTLHSLKIFNQQEQFIHSNISRNNFWWSEWIAPGEIIGYKLGSGSYNIEIEEFETSTITDYSYSLVGDDFLAIDSSNSIWNAINTINTVNTTIGNQITNVEISISNDLSTIESQTVNIEILLENTNSSLTEVLVSQSLVLDLISTKLDSLNISQSVLINAVNSSITSLLADQSIFLEAMNSTIQTILANQSVQLSAVSSDIYAYYVNQMAQLDAVNSTIVNQIIEQGIFLALLNSTLNSLLIDNFVGIESVNSTILSLIADQNLFMQLLDSNITESSILQILAIESVNSTILNYLIQQNTFLDLVANNITEIILQQNTHLNLSQDIETLLISQNIYLETLNSTIVNMLISQSQQMNVLDSSLNSLFLFTNQSFITINNSIEWTYLQLDSSIAFIDSHLTAVHTTIENQLYLLNTSVQYMQTNMTNQMSTFESNITNAFTQLTQDVFLINNSIYTSIATLEQNLDISNNEITGNQEILISMNEYLTQLYQYTLFSEFLNWTNVANNATYLDEQIWDVDFFNYFRNESVQLLLRYEDQIETLEIMASKPLSVMLPREDVEYLIKDTKGEVISDWIEIENKTVKFGTYEEIIPATPADLVVEENDWFIAVGIWILVGIVGIVAVILVMRKIGKKSRYEIMNVPTSSLL